MSSKGLRHLRCPPLDHGRGASCSDPFERAARPLGGRDNIVSSAKYACSPPPGRVMPAPDQAKRRVVSPVLSPVLHPDPPPLVLAHVAVVAAVQKGPPQQLPPIDHANLITPTADLQAWVTQRRVAQCAAEEADARRCIGTDAAKLRHGCAVRFLTGAVGILEAAGRGAVACAEGQVRVRACRRYAQQGALLVLAGRTAAVGRRRVYAALASHARMARLQREERAKRTAYCPSQMSAKQLRHRQAVLEEADGRAGVAKEEGAAFASLCRGIGPAVRALAGELDDGQWAERLKTNERVDAGRILAMEKAVRTHLRKEFMDHGAKTVLREGRLYPLLVRNRNRLVQRYYQRWRRTARARHVVEALAVHSEAAHIRLRFTHLLRRAVASRNTRLAHRTAACASLMQKTMSAVLRRYLERWDTWHHRRVMVRHVAHMEAVNVKSFARRYFRLFAKQPMIRINLGRMEHRNNNIVRQCVFSKWRRLRATVWRSLRPQQKQYRVMEVLAKPCFLRWYRYLALHAMRQRAARAVSAPCYSRWRRWAHRHSQLREVLRTNAVEHRRGRFHVWQRFARRSKRLRESLATLSHRSTVAHLQRIYELFHTVTTNSAKLRRVQEEKSMRAAFLSRIMRTSTYSVYRKVWSRLLLRVVHREQQRRASASGSVSQARVVRRYFKVWIRWCIRRIAIMDLSSDSDDE